MSNAAFINALMEEGTKDDCLRQVVKLWEENCALRERLGPRGLEVVEINDTGHYVNEKVRAEIERLRSQLGKAQVALEKISGHREFDLEDFQLHHLYKRDEGMWTLEEYVADVTLRSLTDETGK